MYYYTVYLNATDEIVASGSARECAKQLHTSIDCFYSLVSKTSQKKIKKYSFISEPYFNQDSETEWKEGCSC